MSWENREHPDRYGNWYCLEVPSIYNGFPSALIWIREPFCADSMYPEDKQKLHDAICPGTGDCGWLMQFTNIGFYHVWLHASSFKEAKQEAINNITTHLEEFITAIKKINKNEI